MSTVGFTVRAFCLTPLETARGFTVVASVATWEAMGESTGDSGSVVSFYCHLAAEVAALALALALFLEDVPPWVFTILETQIKRIQRREMEHELIRKDERTKN